MITTYREIKTISNQLIVLLMIADIENKSDILSKESDYKNCMLALNALLGLPVMYRRKKETQSDDEKKDDSIGEYETKLIEKGNKFYNFKKEKYQTSWNEKQILSFLKEVVTVIDDETNEYDSLIVVLSSYTRDNASYMHIFPSYGNGINLLSIYSLFYNDVCKFSKKRWPMLFIIDRYNECSSKEEAQRLNETRYYT